MMRKTLMMSAAALVLATSAAFAQNSGQTPPNPNAASQVPQPANSAPVGAESPAPTPHASSNAGTNLGGTSSGTMPRAAMNGRHPMRHVRHSAPMHSEEMGGTSGMTRDAAMNDESAPPTSAYRGGAGSPYSTKATNLVPGRSELGARLPAPAPGGNTPQDFLAAAQAALNKGQTGAAQSALEMAETRVLTRSSDADMANQPDQATVAKNIADARRALGAHNVSAAKQAVAAAMSDGMATPSPASMNMPAGNQGS